MVFIAKPFLDDLAADMVHRVIPSGWITQGPEVAGFGREFAAYVGAPHAYAVSNYTTASPLPLRTVTSVGRRNDNCQSFIYPHRQQRPLLRNNAGLRGRQPGHIQHQP
jgi:dTDP-4-amino-4,6-dideoxygalactose transaminase